MIAKNLYILRITFFYYNKFTNLVIFHLSIIIENILAK